jgi:membrane protease YdiL (CAAX protease family)
MTIPPMDFLKPASRLEARRLTLYTWLPAIIFNLGSACLFGVFYAYYYAFGAAATGALTPGKMQFWLSAFIFLVEWSFAIALILSLRRSGISLRQVIAPAGEMWGFRWIPAILLFIAVNILMLIYMFSLQALYGELGYADLAPWQRVAMIVLVPLTAAFCEELIWRGYVLPGWLSTGKRWLAILLSALSFALIHGIFLPDKLLMTFIFGVITGYYYTRQPNLLPLFFTHWFVDFWSYGWLLFLA